MARQISLVQQVQIASPCPASWESMAGDDTTRFCHQCKLNVYNLSAMTAEEGERLIREKEGRICARIYRRADGTVLTQDCPVGLAKLRRRARLVFARIAAAIAFIAGGFTYAKSDVPKSERYYRLANLEPIASMRRWLDSTAPPPPIVSLPQQWRTLGVVYIQPKPDSGPSNSRPNPPPGKSDSAQR